MRLTEDEFILNSEEVGINSDSCLRLSTVLSYLH